MGNVPLGEVLVEGLSMLEHCFHARDLGRVPLRDVAVEYSSTLEHAFHVRDLGRVPLRDVLVERASVLEHRVHVRHLRGVPVGDVAVLGNACGLVGEPQITSGSDGAVGERYWSGCWGRRFGVRDAGVAGVVEVAASDTVPAPLAGAGVATRAVLVSVADATGGVTAVGSIAARVGGGGESGGLGGSGGRDVGETIVSSDGRHASLAVSAAILEVVDDGARKFLLVTQALALVAVVDVFVAVVVLQIILVTAHCGAPVRDTVVLDLRVVAGGALADVSFRRSMEAFLSLQPLNDLRNGRMGVSNNTYYLLYLKIAV